jgi:hypothetical protein
MFVEDYGRSVLVRYRPFGNSLEKHTIPGGNFFDALKFAQGQDRRIKEIKIELLIRGYHRMTFLVSNISDREIEIGYRGIRSRVLTYPKPKDVRLALNKWLGPNIMEELKDFFLDEV